MKPPFYRDWLHRFDINLALRRRMMRALGIKTPRHLTDLQREEIRETMIRCTECKKTSSCMAWLEHGDQKDAPPEFCPNHDLFKRMQQER